MSAANITIERTESLMESLSDWMNPILVKEIRQALKSRQFVATFMLLLVASWFISLFGVIISGARLEFGSVSQDFFRFYFGALSIAILIVVPFTTYRSLLTEQDGQTYELLSITSLSPRQIVWGKLWTALVQILVYYAAISPFVAFTSLLQGFDLFRTVFMMTTLLFASVLLCMFTLMLSTVARNRQIQTLSSLFVFGGLSMTLMMMLGFTEAMIDTQLDLDMEFWWASAAVFVYGLSYFFLFHQITVAQLTFETGNKSTGIRIIAMVQFFLLWGILASSVMITGTTLDDEIFYPIAAISLIHWAVFGFFICMERDDLSRRIRRDLPKNGLLRFLVAPFMPGGTRGFLLVLIHFLIFAILFNMVQPFVSGSGYDEWYGFMTVLSYIIIYLGIGCLMSRWLLNLSTELRPAHSRTLLIVLMAFGVVIPYLILWSIGFYDGFNSGYHILMITNPFHTITEVSSEPLWRDTVLGTLAVGCALIVLLNLMALGKAIHDIFKPVLPVNMTLESSPIIDEQQTQPAHSSPESIPSRPAEV